MAKPTFSTGDVPSASQVNDWFVNVLFVRKTANESVTSSTTLQNDDQLVLAVAANAVYQLTLFLKYDAGTPGDALIQLNVPTSATFAGQLNRLHSLAAASTDTSMALVLHNQANNMGGLGAGVDAAATLQGMLITGGTAGNVQLQFAQNSSSVTATIIQAGSYMYLRRVD